MRLLVQGGEPNYFELATELRIVREMLKALESAIAAMECSGVNGLTRPGTYMLELLGSMQIKTEADLRRVIAKFEVASQIIMEDAADSGHRLAATPDKESAGGILRCWQLLYHPRECSLCM